MPAAIANGESGLSARTKINEGFTDINHGGADNAILRADGAGSIIQSSGVLLGDSDNIIFPAGSGVDFSASAGGGATSSLLDDYEEGTFTPTIQFGGAAVGITYGTQAGVYTKIGNLININLRIILTSKGSSNGDAVILGLPFISGTSGNQQSGGSFSIVNLLTFNTIPSCFALNNSSTILLRELVSGGNETTITDGDFVDTTAFIITITYLT